jgi:beta-galactosidase/beta-glucuronidase
LTWQNRPERISITDIGVTVPTEDLGGAWTLKQAGKRENTGATVPGSVHTDLLAAGKIPDPYYRDNESKDWLRRTIKMVRERKDERQEYKPGEKENG